MLLANLGTLPSINRYPGFCLMSRSHQLNSQMVPARLIDNVQQNLVGADIGWKIHVWKERDGAVF